MGWIFCLAAVLASGMLVPAAASAQGVGTSGISGVVRDATGAVLPGVTVEAASPALIEKTRTVVTDSQGRYLIIDLRPGTYSVSFALAGFSTFRLEALELPANFTAAANADLKVGALEETLTVSGASPVVDVQNLTQQKMLTQDMLRAVPVAQTVYSLLNLMPAVVSTPNSQDVGGSKGESSFRGSLHGGKRNDQRLLVDGMRFNPTQGQGAGFGFYINPAMAEAIVIEVAAGGSAEYSVGGIQMNVVPKTGGNTFSGTFLGNYSGDALVSANLSDDLKARGLSEVNKVLRIHNLNGAVGGPIKRDKLWFYTAYRHWGLKQQPVNHFYDSTLGSFLYTPDLDQPGQPIQTNRSGNGRLTWQALPKHKLSFYTDHQKNDDCPNHEVIRLAPEAVPCLIRGPASVSQVTWSYPVTNRLLFDAGATAVRNDRERTLTPSHPSHPHFNTTGFTPADISVLEQSTGIRYQAPNSLVTAADPQRNSRFSMSYVTGSHHLKVGFSLMQGSTTVTTTRPYGDVSYTFSNGTPISLTEWAAPTTTKAVMWPEFGLYAQDQWTVKRLTLNFGLRFESLHAYVPASQQPAGPLIDARSFDEVDCVPCWKDLGPRLGMAYDLSGNGKTAVKASIGRYVVGEFIGLATANDPVTTSVNSVNRAWTDTNRNFFPDCDLRNPAANNECREIDNLNFGKSNIVTRYDPDLLNGWHKRAFSWQGSASIEHELRPGVAVSAGYFRTWFGNFTVTDNLEVTPGDFDPYCITAPVDPRLPGGGGNQICGLYDITPALFGRVNNLVTFASHYGEQSEVYNGFDLNVNVRLRRGAQLSAGLNVGNSGNSDVTGGETVSATDRCFVVDSPQQLYQCRIRPPYAKQFKITGSYQLPWALQGSANFQSLPGFVIGANYSVPTAQIAPSLGRNLAGGARTASLQVIDPFSQFEGRINQLDLRLARMFQLRQVRVEAMVDAYNALNVGAVLGSNPTYGASWRNVTEVLTGRLLKFGVHLQF